MKNTRTLSKEAGSNRNSSTKSSRNADGTVEVLYQKMGERWFAFSLLGDEVFVGSISPEEISGEEGKALTPRKREIGLT